MNDDPLPPLCYIQPNDALGERTRIKNHSVWFNKYLLSMSFVQGDGMDLDMNMGPTQKGGALWNAIFYWETVSDLSDVCSYIMRMNHPPPPLQVSLHSTKWVGLCPMSSAKDSTLTLGFCLSRNSKNTQSSMNQDAVPVRPNPMEQEKGIHHWFLCKAPSDMMKSSIEQVWAEEQWHEKLEVKVVWGWVRRKLLGR